MSDAGRHEPLEAMLLLGTVRMQAVPPPPHPLLDAPWKGLDWSRREEAALGAAALLSAARSAGATPARGAATPAPCPQEPRPRCGPAAAALLRRMLGDEHKTLLPEWLALAREAGLVAEHRDLPALLERGRLEPRVRPALGPVLGARGAWLARQHEGWGWALGDVPAGTSAWTTGTREERIGWLRQQHAADPARAAEALIETWPSEDGDSREALLEIVAGSPHPRLEPMLERQALSDRRAAIRQLARKALVRIAGSAFSARALERARPLVRLEGILKKRLVLAMPAAFDPAWRDDGIEEEPPQGTGQRAFWSRQLLANVPLAAWQQSFGADAMHLFAWNRDEASQEVLQLAWTDSLLLAPQPEPALAFVRQLLLGGTWPRRAPPRVAFAHRLLRELPAKAAVAALDAISAPPADELFAELLLHDALPCQPSDPARTADCITSLLAHAKPGLGQQAAVLASRVPAGEIARVLRAFAARHDLSADAEAFLRVLEFRQACRAAFAAPPRP